MIAYMLLGGLGLERALEHLDRVLGWGNCMEPLLAVPASACRVHDAHDHLLHAEPPLRDLGDDQICVVAVGRRDEYVGPLDAGRDQRLDLECRPDRELTLRVLPALT